jgi:HAD superfamily hydrolase (TIGR01509 family)
VKPFEIGKSRVSELIIYDCDGTLIDSERLVAKVCLAEIHALGLKHWTMERYYAAFVGMPGDVGWSTVARELGRDLDAEFRDRVDQDIGALFETELSPLPGVREAVTTIGGTRCVASSTALGSLKANISRAGLADLFGEHVFSASQVRRAKPAPDVFLFAASQMGHDPKHCIVIEDSVPGVAAARRAGMTVIGYTGSAHEPQAMQARLLKAGAVSVAGHMEHLPRLIRAL